MEYKPLLILNKKSAFSEKLMRMARKMRMNTDSRKNIFCLIMSSEDYIDATMRLTKLGTKNQTEREVMFVLLECSLKAGRFVLSTQFY